MEHDIYFLLKLYSITNFIFGTKKNLYVNEGIIKETSLSYKVFFAIFGIGQFFITLYDLNPFIVKWKNISSEAHLIFTLCSFLSLSLTHTIIILHSIFEGCKNQRIAFVSIIDLDKSMGFPKFQGFKMKISTCHLVYAFVKISHIVYDFIVWDSYALLPQFTYHFSMLATEIELLHYIVEINEISSRFYFFNSTLESFLKFNINNEGLLMKIWQQRKSKYNGKFRNINTSMKHYCELMQVMDNILSCYSLAVLFFILRL